MSDEISSAIKALKPFAEMARAWDASEPDTTIMDHHDKEDGVILTLGHCRRAAEACDLLGRSFRSVPVSVGPIMPAGGGSREGEQPVADDFSARDWRRACVTLLQNLDALAKLTSTELIDEDAMNVGYIRHMIEVTRDQHSLEVPQSFFRLDKGSGP